MPEFFDKNNSIAEKRNIELKKYADSFLASVYNRKSVSYDSVPEKKEKIEDIIIEQEKIKNAGIEQDITLRKKTLNLLFKFLVGETIVIFLFSFFQAIHNPWNFALEEWSFKLLVTATISQITIMLLVAVKYLFPNPKGRIE